MDFVNVDEDLASTIVVVTRAVGTVFDVLFIVIFGGLFASLILQELLGIGKVLHSLWIWRISLMILAIAIVFSSVFHFSIIFSTSGLVGLVMNDLIGAHLLQESGAAIMWKVSRVIEATTCGLYALLVFGAIQPLLLHTALLAPIIIGNFGKWHTQLIITITALITMPILIAHFLLFLAHMAIISLEVFFPTFNVKILDIEILGDPFNVLSSSDDLNGCTISLFSFVFSLIFTMFVLIGVYFSMYRFTRKMLNRSTVKRVKRMYFIFLALNILVAVAMAFKSILNSVCKNIICRVASVVADIMLHLSLYLFAGSLLVIFVVNPRRGDRAARKWKQLKEKRKQQLAEEKENGKEKEADGETSTEMRETDAPMRRQHTARRKQIRTFENIEEKYRQSRSKFPALNIDENKNQKAEKELVLEDSSDEKGTKKDDIELPVFSDGDDDFDIEPDATKNKQSLGHSRKPEKEELPVFSDGDDDFDMNAGEKVDKKKEKEAESLELPVFSDDDDFFEDGDDGDFKKLSEMKSKLPQKAAKKSLDSFELDDQNESDESGDVNTLHLMLSKEKPHSPRDGPLEEEEELPDFGSDDDW